jgi:hypothetical protein
MNAIEGPEEALDMRFIETVSHKHIAERSTGTRLAGPIERELPIEEENIRMPNHLSVKPTMVRLDGEQHQDDLGCCASPRAVSFSDEGRCRTVRRIHEDAPVPFLLESIFLPVDDALGPHGTVRVPAGVYADRPYYRLNLCNHISRG